MRQMKIHLTHVGVALCLSLTSCSDFNKPLRAGSFNPLLAPGAQLIQPENAGANYPFSPGQYVTAASDSTAFFAQKPQGNADADELLSAGTSMRVIKAEGSFVKVELDSGRVGYVAAALLLEPGRTPAPLDSTTETSPAAPAADTSGEEAAIPPLVTPETIPPIEVPLPEPADSQKKSNP